MVQSGILNHGRIRPPSASRGYYPCAKSNGRPRVWTFVGLKEERVYKMHWQELTLLHGKFIFVDKQLGILDNQSEKKTELVIGLKLRGNNQYDW